MRLFTVLATISLASFAVAADYDNAIENVYKFVCKQNQIQKSDGSVAFDDASIFQTITGFALGTQVTPTDTGSTCFEQARQTKVFLDNIVNSFYTLFWKSFSPFDWSKIQVQFSNLIFNINSFGVQLADQAVACEDNKKIKQFATRTQEWSGLFNTLFTTIYGIGYDYLYTVSWLSWLPKPTTKAALNVAADTFVKQIYNYFANLNNAAFRINCSDLGRNFGIIVSEILEAKTDSIVPFVEVQKII